LHAKRRNQIGVSLPRQGSPTRINERNFQRICQLVFTCQSIEQANCDPNRLDRQDFRSKVGEIVNVKLSNDGLNELNTVKFYEKIQAALSADCHITAVNSREALRAAWLTYGNQENHYTGWECALVNLGFGRWASEGEKGKSGNVHFYHDQVQRVVQFDEMGFLLDGSKNGKGGRPTATPTNPFLPESGKPVNKSSGKTSWMFGCNFADEALPPMVVLPSTAETPRVKAHLIRNMHQVRGKFGYPTERGFSCTFAVSENAGVTDKIF
jgi:hypothetical protein